MGLKEAIDIISVNQKEDLDLPSVIDVLQSGNNCNNDDLNQVVWCVCAAAHMWTRAPPPLGDRVGYYAQHSAIEIALELHVMLSYSTVNPSASNTSRIAGSTLHEVLVLRRDHFHTY